MAHHKDAIKRIRTSLAARARNRANRSRMRGELKKIRGLIDAGNTAEARALLPATQSILHRLARKRVIHRNAANRRISRLAIALQKLEG